MKNSINNTGINSVDFISPTDLAGCGIFVHEDSVSNSIGGLGRLEDGSPVGWEVRKTGKGFAVRVGLLPVSSQEYHTDFAEKVKEALAQAVGDLNHYLENVESIHPESKP